MKAGALVDKTGPEVHRVSLPETGWRFSPNHAYAEYDTRRSKCAVVKLPETLLKHSVSRRAAGLRRQYLPAQRY